MCMMTQATPSPAPSLDNLADLTLERVDNLLNSDSFPKPLYVSPLDDEG